MKSQFIGAMGTAILLVTGLPAQAQTHVSLYGRVVAGVDYQNNVDLGNGKSGSLLRAADNQWGTSMLGLRGVEDLGDGLQAFFNLEGGFGAANGASGDNGFHLNRRSLVGFRAASWGTLTIGKNQPVADALWAIDPTGQQYIGSATLVRGRNWPGYNNMISYETPLWNGFSAQAVTSMGEQPGGSAKGRKDALLLTFARPDYELRLIYDLARDQNGKYSDLFSTSKELTIGGTWTLDKAKLFAGYEHLSAPDVSPGSPDKANHYWLGARYQASTAMTLIGAVYRVDVKNGGGSANLFMLGTDYELSKRTLLYASVGTVRNSANANFSVEATNNNPRVGKNQMGIYAGIAHSF